MTISRFLLVALLCANAIAVYAQEPTALVTGTVIEREDKTPIITATVRLIAVTDSLLIKGALTSKTGTFSIANVPFGRYHMKATFVGMRPVDRDITISSDKVDLGTIILDVDTTNFTRLEVTAIIKRAEQKGDTTEFNANGYKVNPNASSEDLVAKMPGVTIENGTVKSQGENIQRVTVDGREFFGDDASATLKNLPAEMVDKVQVYDRGSDQSMYSGFDDGNVQRTMNIVTKSDKRQGSFGKISGGYGSIDRYVGSGTYNYFNNAQRITILGISNNINQQNFNFSDMFGSSGGGNRGMGGQGGGGFRGMGGPGGGGNRGMGGQGGGGGDMSNFFVGQQNGITQTHALGVNYSDQFGRFTNLSASYFVNWAGNDRSSILTRDYITDAQTQYDQNNIVVSDNLNHRLNMRFETYFDTTLADVVSFSPRLTIQDNTSRNNLEGVFTNSQGGTLSRTTTQNRTDNMGLSLNQTLTYRHRFDTTGRNISLSASTDYSNRDNDGSLISLNEYLDQMDSSSSLNQQSTQTTKGLTLSGTLSYIEPVGERDMLQFSYNPSWTKNSSDKATNALDSLNLYTIAIPDLSNKYDNDYITQKAGLLYRLRYEDVIITAGANYQLASLSGNQSFPTATVIDRTFNNILPSLNAQIRFDKSTNLRMNYRTSTNAPSISQLQSVLDNSNPLQLSIGNANLSQDYSHNLFIRYNSISSESGTNFFIFMMGGYTQSYIGQSIEIASADTVLPNGVELPAGSQLTTYQNLDGYYNFRSYSTYGFPFSAIGSNLNLNAGLTYSRTPSLINQSLNLASSLGINGGFYLGTTASENLDGFLSYSGTYTIVNNTLRSQLNANYFNHMLTARVVWRIGALACSTDVTNIMYSGLGSAYNQLYTVWGAGVGYRFMADDAAEIRLSIYDILGQNTSVSRSVTETYIEDQGTKALTRYAMVTFTYDFRAFGGGDASRKQGGPGGPPGSFPGMR